MAGKKKSDDWAVMELAPRKGKRRLYRRGISFASIPNPRLLWSRRRASSPIARSKPSGYGGLAYALDMHHDHFLTWEEQRAKRDKLRKPITNLG